VESSGHGELFGAERGEGKDGRRANLDEGFVAELRERVGMKYLVDGRGDLEGDFGPEDVLGYIYGVLHWPRYRSRYAEFLKIDFPRIPLPVDREMFVSFARVGHELMSLHLMESDLLGDESKWPGFAIAGDNEVEAGYPKYVWKAKEGDKGRVYINGDQYFEGVRKEVWEFYVGGYQVCEKWLKDRRGRKLRYDDINHYQKICVVLGETIRLMGSEVMEKDWIIG